MSERLTRTFAGDLEVRAGASGEGRTIVGLAVPFDTLVEINDSTGSYSERFVRGSFARTISERGPEKVKLLSQHRHLDQPLGRAVLFREDAAGLYGEFRVSKTDRGDEALELVRDGTLDSFSIGFDVIRDDWTDRTVRTVLEARLFEVSLVSWPAYESALIAGVRSKDASSTPLLSVARAQLTLHSRRRPVNL